MRFATTLLALAATGFLAACTEEPCTTELAQKKSLDLSQKLSEVVAADPAKLIELGPKVQEIAARASAEGEDLQAVCKAMDEMMVELSK